MSRSGRVLEQAVVEEKQDKTSKMALKGTYYQSTVIIIKIKAKMLTYFATCGEA